MTRTAENKGRSPFFPGQPVPPELFVGRKAEIDQIMRRGAGQAAAGKPVSLFIQGEYGIGKSSIALLTQGLAAARHGLHTIYVPLSGASTMEEMGTALLSATVRSGVADQGKWSRVKKFLGRYVSSVELFGVKLDLRALGEDGPPIASHYGLLSFLSSVHNALKGPNHQGLFVVFDEINGIAAHPKFAHLFKGLVDTNASSPSPLPLLLGLCGIAERRGQMIHVHQPVERIFDIVDIPPMQDDEASRFFAQAFQSVGVDTDPQAVELLAHFSSGSPRVMHIMGECAFWSDVDGRIDAGDVLNSLSKAATDIESKFLDQRVYRALRSKDYHTILLKIPACTDPRTLIFKRRDLFDALGVQERPKLDNLLRRLERLQVIRKGTEPGEHEFLVRMVYVSLLFRRQIDDPEVARTIARIVGKNP